jgi:hypothetical protein
MTTKYIFVDLDECLFHSRPLGGYRTEAEMLIKPGEALINARKPEDPEDYDDFYGSHLRPGAIEFLNELRKIPDSRLSVLTSSVTPYANACNKAHGLGFDPKQIYAREELRDMYLDPDSFGDGPGPVYLIDNLPRHENRIKVNFLREIATNNVRYIKVPEYWGDPELDRVFDSFLINDILRQINDLHNS